MPRCLRTALAVVVLTLLPVAAAAQYSRISVASDGTEGNGPSHSGAFTPSGSHVAFVSAATNLVPGDTNAVADVFVRDLLAGTTTRVSVASDGTERPGESVGPVDISDDGRFVVFASRAALVPADTRLCTVPPEITPANCQDIYLRDRLTSETVRLSVAGGGAEADGPSSSPRITGNGRWVVFVSTATNLVPDDTNGVADIFLLDRQTGIVCVSRSTAGVQADLASGRPSISDDGNVIAFLSAATTLSAEIDPTRCLDAGAGCTRPFLHDRASGLTRRLPLPPSHAMPEFTTPERAIDVEVAPDGRTVAAQSVGPLFSPKSPPPYFGWVFDRAADRVTIESGAGIGLAWDGRRLAYGTPFSFNTGPGVLVVYDTVTDVRDPQSSFPFLPSTATDLASNGRYCLFTTDWAAIPADSNLVMDVYLFDRDPDADGMPSSWETQFGFDPANAADAAGDPDLDGITALDEYLGGTHPAGVAKRYFAEGASNAFFRTQIALFNPGPQPATAVVRRLGQNGRVATSLVTVSARTRTGFALTGADDSFSTLIDSNQPLVADRTMSWGAHGYGSHAETAVEAPSTTWFLAEGATHGGFQLFYLLQNPTTSPASVTVTYLRPSPAPPITKTYAVGPSTRRTIVVEGEDPGLRDVDVSARLVSDQPIVVERAMYRDVANPPQVFGAGHVGLGVTQPLPRWFLAEGATGPFFDLYYLIANPAPQPTRVRVTYLLPAGNPIVKEYAVDRESRYTISVRDEDPRLLNTPVSATLESLDGGGIVVERAMWWPGYGQWQEGHLAAGSTATARRWALAEGEVWRDALSGVETYVLIANPSTVSGTATVTLIGSSGAISVHPVPLPPNSRVSLPMSAFVAGQFLTFSVLVESDGPEIIVERAMYSNADGLVWAAGTAALGSRLP